MEEKYYYIMRFLNSSELFLKTSLNTDKLISKFDAGSFSSGFIKLRQINTERNREPVCYTKSSVMSIEKVNEGMIGNSNKIWEIVE